MTERDRQAFRNHLESALEHANTLSVWGFVSLIAFISIVGDADQPHEIALALAGVFSGGMAGMNLNWGWQEFARANRIAKRNKP